MTEFMHSEFRGYKATVQVDSMEGMIAVTVKRDEKATYLMDQRATCELISALLKHYEEAWGPFDKDMHCV